MILPLLTLAAFAHAGTISDNLSNLTAGTETSSGTTWLSARFGTGSTVATLTSATLLLANANAGAAELDLYSDNTLQPGSLLGTLTSPASYSSTLSATTFSSSGIALSADSTYWIVLKALGGEFDWAWTADNSGTGTGFQGTWGISTDRGITWFSSAVYPTQFSVTTSDAATPEPGTALLAFGGLLPGAALLSRKQRV